MAIAAVVIVGVLAFVIAAFVIGREARRLGAQQLQPVYRLSEAVSSLAADLPDETASVLTADELERVARTHLNVLQFGAGTGDELDPDDDAKPEDETSVVDIDDTVQLVYRQVRRDGLEVSRPDVEAVIAAHLRYLAAIGAIGLVEDE